MKLQPNFRFLLILMATLLAACAPGESTPTATEVSIDAIYTSAAKTLMAQLSETAAAKPTATITATATITPTGTVTPTKAPQQVVVAPPVVVVQPTSGTPGLTPTATFGAVGCNNSAFLADVNIPDGTTIAAGKKFTKTWSIKNTGTCSWTSNFKFTFIGGDLMGSDTFKIRRIVGPNISTEISVTDFTAPTSPGTYTGTWRMADDKGVLFGTSFTVSIKVAGATFTPSAVVTRTPTPVATTAVPTTVVLTATPILATPTATSAPTTAPSATTAATDPATSTPETPTGP